MITRTFVEEIKHIITWFVNVYGHVGLFFSVRGFGHPVFLKPHFGHPVMKILAKTLCYGTPGNDGTWVPVPTRLLTASNLAKLQGSTLFLLYFWYKCLHLYYIWTCGLNCWPFSSHSCHTRDSSGSTYFQLTSLSILQGHLYTREDI